MGMEKAVGIEHSRLCEETKGALASMKADARNRQGELAMEVSQESDLFEEVIDGHIDRMIKKVTAEKER